MAQNSLVMIRDQFEIDRLGDTVDITATHPKHGRVTVTVDVFGHDDDADEYAMTRWVALVGDI